MTGGSDGALASAPPTRSGLAAASDDVVADALAAADTETLLGEDSERFGAVLDGAEPGPLAVVGPPYSGRGRVLDAAAERLDARRIALEPGAGADPVLDALGSGPLVIEGCHHLYERRIGGFEPLRAVRATLPEADGPVVTGWNATAWAYLTATRDLERSFPAVVTVDALDGETVAAILDAAVTLPACRLDDSGPDPVVSTRGVTLSVRGRAFTLPVPTVQRSRLSAALADDDADPMAAVFDRVTAAADGNLGVAAAILHRCAEDVLRPGDVSPAGAGLEFDGDERFCLRLLLGGELTRRETLGEIVGEGTAPILARFSREGLVAADDTFVRLLPAAVPTVTRAVTRGRIL